ncbi:putative acetyltransferase YhhY [Planctomycetes bacterium Poly30]|uniref:Putative acetyltransferase YhhY n=1 Tax=Saltatorellus ferox TaxID=2528018 RepID=A0A518EW33_9BACT|nr:putative acetyltransferase YhhY [Planctomycetes bacterium Poly30]
MSDDTAATPPPHDITIRGLAPSDGEALSVLYAAPGAVWGTLQMPFPHRHLWLDRTQSPTPGIHQLVACSGERVVGHLGLHLAENPRRRHTAGFGMAVDDGFQRRGAGGALLDAAIDLAENWYGVLRLELEVYVDNEPAIGLYRSRGFEVEGVKRAFALRGGSYVDTLVMSRLRLPEGILRVKGPDLA